MYQGFEAHGVSIVLEATVPALSVEPTDFSILKPLDDVAEQIKAAGTRIIYSYVFQPADMYLYHEAIRLEFAPSFGYQWLGVIYILFPSTTVETVPPSPPPVVQPSTALSPGHPLLRQTSPTLSGVRPSMMFTHKWTH